MSEVENDAIAELSKKIMTVGKNVKLLYEMIKLLTRNLMQRQTNQKIAMKRRKRLTKSLKRKG